MRRCSNGKSNSVASIWPVSSIDTLSTQSNASPRGKLSSVFWMRLRIRPSNFARFAGETIGCTILRCSSCLGWSMAMNIGSSRSPVRSRSVMPPKVDEEENALWFTSTETMSLYLLIDQKGPIGLSLQ